MSDDVDQDERPPEWWDEDEEEEPLACDLCSCIIGDECCLGEPVWDRPICHRCAAPMVGEED